jgi:hypothetical protein
MAEDTTTSSTAQAPIPMLAVSDARGRFMRTKEPRTDFTIVDGAEVALVIPTEGERGEIQQASVDIDKNGRVSTGNFAKRRGVTVIAMVHTIVVDPTTGANTTASLLIRDEVAARATG